MKIKVYLEDGTTVDIEGEAKDISNFYIGKAFPIRWDNEVWWKMVVKLELLSQTKEIE